MPIETIQSSRRTSYHFREVRFADPGDIVALRNDISTHLFLRHGLNAGKFQPAGKKNSFYSTYAKSNDRFIIIAARDIYPFSDDGVSRLYCRPSLLLPLKDGEQIDVDGPLVLIRQMGAQGEMSAGMLLPIITDFGKMHNYSEIAIDQKPDLLDQLQVATAFKSSDTPSSNFLHTLKDFASVARDKAHMAAKEKRLPMIASLRHSASELLANNCAAEIMESNVRILESGLREAQEAAEYGEPLLPRAIAATPGELMAHSLSRR